MYNKKIILVIIIVFFVSVVGYFVFVRNFKPIIRPQNQAQPTQTNLTPLSSQSTQPIKNESKNKEQVNKQEEVVQNCGTSNTFASVISSDFEKKIGLDNALACIGKNLLNGCIASKAILKTYDTNDLYYIVTSGKSDSEYCKIRFQHPEVNKISDVNNLQYANEYIECPVSGIYSTGFITKKREVFLKEPSSNAGYAGYAGGLYMALNFYQFQNNLSNIGCTASLDELLKSTKEQP